MTRCSRLAASRSLPSFIRKARPCRTAASFFTCRPMPATLGVPTRPNLPWSVISKAPLLLSCPRLAHSLAGRVEAYAALCEAAQSEQNARRARLDAAADAVFDAPITTPLVAAREMARAIGPDIAIVDEAVATSLHLRGFLTQLGNIPFHVAVRSAGACRQRWASHSASIARRSCRSSVMVRHSTHHKRGSRWYRIRCCVGVGHNPRSLWTGKSAH